MKRTDTAPQIPDVPAALLDTPGNWMTVRDAADAWGCSRQTVYRLIEQYPERLLLGYIYVQTRDGRTRRVLALRSGAQRPELKPGNPRFNDPAFQTLQAWNRWYKKRPEEGDEQPHAENVQRDL